MIKLSIIIPAFNAEPFIYELLKTLDPQITEEIEVIIVDDGSKNSVHAIHYPWAKVYRMETNKGASAARNKGLDEAVGEYIAFIDADDMVANNYISSILNKINTEHPDYMYLSWKTIEGSSWKCNVKIQTIDDEFPPYNLCVWNRIYKKSVIGDLRFNENKLIAEDAEFIHSIDYTHLKKAVIPNYIYFYRSDTPDSLSKKFNRGELSTDRIAYYYKYVTKDMTFLIDEFKKEYERAEIILLTTKNDIPELSKYAMIMAPCKINATEKWGEPNDYINLINKPIKAEIVMWTQNTYEIGGIETFIYQFSKIVGKLYDLVILYDKMDIHQIERVSKYATCIKNDPNTKVICNKLIVNRIIDRVPSNIIFNESIQMVHGIKNGSLHVPQDKNKIVSVSKAVKESFGRETENSLIIRNMIEVESAENKRMLRFISTTRTDTKDKGVKRMIDLANLMNEQGINYIWQVFTNCPLPSDAPSNMIKMEPVLDIAPNIKNSDYLIQLSDHEAFCYSIVEALTLNKPVIVTPLEVLKELNIKDGINSYIVPFEIDSKFDTTKFYNIPEFEYSYDNTESIKAWKDLLGDNYRTKSIAPSVISVMATINYTDLELRSQILKGDILKVSPQRALYLKNLGLVKIL